MKQLREIRTEKSAVFTFGRMNPPTIGHEKLIRKVLEVARKENAKPFVYVSFTQDPKRNPLTNKQKIKFLKLGIPDAAEAIIEDPKVRTPYEALGRLIELGYRNITMVLGSDRVLEFSRSIKPYINHPDPKKSFDLSSFKIVSAGERDPDKEGVSGISASKMREAAILNDFTQFKLGVPSGLSDRFAREMFDLVRKGLKIAEEIIRTKNSMNIPRNKMPQIKEIDIKAFIRDLEKDGIPVMRREMPISTLKPTQGEIDLDRVKKKFDDFADGAKAKPFIVSLDNFVLDGHHQLYALKTLYSTIKVPSYVVGLKMSDLLKLARDFPKVSYKTINQTKDK